MSDEKTEKTEKDAALTTEKPAELAPIDTVEGSFGAGEGEPLVETAVETAAEKPVDSASPEAIARRMAALGDEDPEEAKARDEERKLAERRAGANSKKKGIKKSGLEVSASKKLSKIGTRAEPKRNIAIASDADPLIEKTAKLSEWAKENQTLVQVVGGLIIVALLGIGWYVRHEHTQETEASALLTQAVDDERARVGEPPKEDPENPVDAPLSYKTFDERREAALKKFRDVESKYPKTGAAILSRLAEGSLLLDKHEADPAIAAFTEVKASPLAAADKEVKGRCIEGIGFAYELKAQAAPAGPERTKNLDEALKTYKELETALDVRGFKELAIYHQARVTQDLGDKDKAKELLVGLKERIEKPDDMASSAPMGPSFPYLKEVAMDRLREIDPSAAPKTAPPPSRGGGAGAAGGQNQLSPEQIKKMIEDAQRKQKAAGGGNPHGGK